MKECRHGYFVSDDGKVFSTYRTEGKPFRELKQDKIWTGYNRVRLATSTGFDRVLVHVLVLEAFVGPRPSPNHEARHLDGDRQNNSVSNLAWGTRADNQIDKLKLDGNILMEDDVKEIRRLLGTSILQNEIADLFNVSRQTITDIKYRRTWNYLE